MRYSNILGSLLLLKNVLGLTVQTTSAGTFFSSETQGNVQDTDSLDVDSIRSAAGTAAHGLMSLYNGNETVSLHIQGVNP